MTSNRCVCVLALAWACALLAGGAGCTQPAASRPAATTPRPPRPPVWLAVAARPTLGAFDKLDDDAVAKTLQEFSMGELLAALAREDANSPATSKRAVAADLFLEQAGTLANQRDVDSLIDKAVMLLDGIIAETKGAKAPKVLAQHFKARLTLVSAEGMGRIQLCVQRQQYLLDSPADRARIIRYADAALKALAELEADINAVLAGWRTIPETRVNAALYQVEELQKECRFRKAWLLFYRAAATPKTGPDRRLRDDMLAPAKAK